MTKAVTAVALMQLVEQQAVALDDPAGEHVPYVRDVQVLTGFGDDGTALFRAPARPVTIRHLLTHTAGFAYPWVDEMMARHVGVCRDACRARSVLGRSLGQQPTRLVREPGHQRLCGGD